MKELILNFGIKLCNDMLMKATDFEAIDEINGFMNLHVHLKVSTKNV